MLLFYSCISVYNIWCLLVILNKMFKPEVGKKGLVKKHSVIILGKLLLFPHKNMYYGYSLEVPHWGTTNE